MSNLRVFTYNKQKITFDFGDGNRMINATEMANIFGKKPTYFLRSKQTQAFIKVLSQVANLQLEKIVKVIHGGNQNGTWIHEKLALKLAAWLSPEFELWVFEKIEEILRNEYEAFHSAPPQDVTYIYFLKSVNLNRVKIGMTENIHNRWNSLKTMSSDELELIKLIRTSTIYPTDTAIHALFPHLRLHGEWFQLDKELETFIEALTPSGTSTAKTVLSYEIRIAELEAQIAEQQKRLFKNKHLIEQLTQELGLLQKQYRQIQTLQIPAGYFSSTNPLALPISDQQTVENTIYQTTDKELQASFFVHHSSQYHQIHLNDITYIQTENKTAIIFTKNGDKFPSDCSLKEFKKLLPSHNFFYISRKHIIHIPYLTSIDISKKTVTIGTNTVLPISRGQFKALIAQIRVLKRNM